MAQKIKLVQGDSRPQIKCVITDETTGTVVNLAGATVRLKFKAVGGAGVLFTLVGILLAGLEQEGADLSVAPPYDVAGIGGRVAFQFGLTTQSAATDQLILDGLKDPFWDIRSVAMSNYEIGRAHV